MRTLSGKVPLSLWPASSTTLLPTSRALFPSWTTLSSALPTNCFPLSTAPSNPSFILEKTNFFSFFCGAGGGGCLFCYGPPAKRDAIREALAAGGARILDYRIEHEGLRVG